MKYKFLPAKRQIPPGRSRKERRASETQIMAHWAGDGAGFFGQVFAWLAGQAWSFGFATALRHGAARAALSTAVSTGSPQGQAGVQGQFDKRAAMRRIQPPLPAGMVLGTAATPCLMKSHGAGGSRSNSLARLARPRRCCCAWRLFLPLPGQPSGLPERGLFCQRCHFRLAVTMAAR